MLFCGFTRRFCRFKVDGVLDRASGISIGAVTEVDTPLFSHSPHVLIVDDDRNVLRMIGRLLVREGAQVRTAFDGAAALRLAAASRPDLVLLDIHLPDQDGYRVCGQLKAQPDTAHVPIVFLSGERETAAVVKGLELGAVDFITKPFEEHILLARVRNHLMLGRLTRDLRAEVAVRTRELVDSHHKLQRLAADAALAEERERRRLADRLHDGAIQSLAFVAMRLRADPQASGQSLACAQTLDEAGDDLRGLVFDLSPPQLHRCGLSAALRSLVERHDGFLGIEIAYRETCPLDPLLEDLAILAFQAARELLVNVLKHAMARSAVVVAERRVTELQLVVMDDGRGPVEVEDDRQAGFGLYSLRQRLEPFGGRLTLSGRGGGTRATLSIPLNPLPAAVD